MAVILTPSPFRFKGCLEKSQFSKEGKIDRRRRGGLRPFLLFFFFLDAGGHALAFFRHLVQLINKKEDFRHQRVEFRRDLRIQLQLGQQFG